MFLPFSLPSPVSFLKLPIYDTAASFLHGMVIHRLVTLEVFSHEAGLRGDEGSSCSKGG